MRLAALGGWPRRTAARLQPGRNHLWVAVGIVVVVAVSAGLRLAALGHLSFYGDEAWTIRWSRRPVAWIMRHYQEGLTMHGYIVLVKYWRELFGSSELTLKLPSLVAGIALPPTLFLCARRWIEPPVALLAALLAAFDYRLIVFSQMGRVYAILVLWAVGSMAFAAWLESAPRRGVRGFAGLGVLNALGIALSLTGVYVVAVQGAWLLGEMAMSREVDRRRALVVGLCVSSLVTGVGVLAFYWPTLPAIVAFTTRFSGSERPWSTTLTVALGSLHLTRSGLLLGVGLVGAWHLIGTARGRMIVYWSFLPPLLFLVSNPRFPADEIGRYFLTALPAHLLLLATGWVRIGSWVASRRRVVLGAACALLSVVWGWTYVRPSALPQILSGGAPHALTIKKLQKIAPPDGIVLTVNSHERWFFDRRIRAQVRSVDDQIRRPLDLGWRPLFVVTPRRAAAEAIWKQAFWLHPIEDEGWRSQYALLEAKRSGPRENRESLVVLFQGMIEAERRKPRRAAYRHHRRMARLLRGSAELMDELGDPDGAASHRAEAEEHERAARRASRDAV